MKNLKQVFEGKKNKTESPIERIIVDTLVGYGFNNFQTQYKLDPYRVDIAFPKYKIALEIDGQEFHTNKQQVTRDNLRDEFLNEIYGWKVERVAGYIAYRYPLIPVAKVFRHIPEYQKLPIYKDACNQLQSWYLIQRYSEEGN